MPIALAAGVLASTAFLAKHTEAQQPSFASIVGAINKAAGSSIRQQPKGLSMNPLAGGREREAPRC